MHSNLCPGVSKEEETEKDGEDGLDAETAVAAARMLDFQIKSCRHLDKSPCFNAGSIKI